MARWMQIVKNHGHEIEVLADNQIRVKDAVLDTNNNTYHDDVITKCSSCFFIEGVTGNYTTNTIYDYLGY